MRYACIKFARLRHVDYPRFRGAAPLHHTLLAGHEKTGVTIQTLHPTSFDRGKIIAQTPYPGFVHHCNTVPELTERTSREGAELLLHSIKEGAFLPPVEKKGNLLLDADLRAIKSAPKITPEDRHIDWRTWTAEKIFRTHSVVGRLWNKICLNDRGGSARGALSKRVIWTSGFEAADDSFVSGVEPGFPFLKDCGRESASAYIQTCDHKCLEVKHITIEGGPKNHPESSSRHAGAFSGNTLQHTGYDDDASHMYELFHHPLL